MANKTLFKTIAGKFIPNADTTNEAGGKAYSLTAEQALAQYAATGCLNKTFYAGADQQLQTILDLCEKVAPEFIARTALYARSKGYMKDCPALLCAVLSVRSPGLLAEIFDRVIDNGKMLRNFVQIMRSGVVGRKSLGTLPKRLVLQWLENRTDESIFRASVGNDPSLTDIIKMVHPKPTSAQRNALFAYLIGRDHNEDDLPQLIKDYEAFKRGEITTPPDVPFQKLTALDLTKENWKEIARNAPWQMTRMNLNTFARHGVFEDRQMVDRIASRLRTKEAIARAKVFPYQLMTAYAMTATDVPTTVREALQDAMEIAIDNVPRIDGKVYVLPDISGSMHWPATGYRKGATSMVRCIDIAALIAAAILRKNRDAEVIPFESKAVTIDLNPRDSVMTNARKLASLPCGGTNCSAPLTFLNKRKAQGDLIIYVSDNESWIDSPSYGSWGGGRTETMNRWATFKKRCPNARMVCLDIQPYATTQAKERNDIMNIGGFSDSVFDVIAQFASGHLTGDHWVKVIESERL